MFALLATAAMAIGSSLMGSKEQQEQLDAQNKAGHVANLQNAVEVAQEVGTLNAQQTILRDRVSSTREASKRQGLLALGSAEAQAASAGVQGASVDAVMQDINRELGASEMDIGRAAEVEQFNMQTRLKSLISNAKAGIYTPQQGPSRGSVIGSAVASGVLAAGSAYVSNYFQYGASKPAAKTSGTTGGWDFKMPTP